MVKVIKNQETVTSRGAYVGGGKWCSGRGAATGEHEVTETNTVL